MGRPIRFHLRRLLECTKTRRWYAGTAVRTSFSPQGSKSFTQLKGLRTNRPDALNAVQLVRLEEMVEAIAVRDRCLQLSALIVAKKQRFRSSPLLADQSTVRTVLPITSGHTSGYPKLAGQADS